MCNAVLLICLVVVVASTWANSEDGPDLNLEAVFRTPKDFSKVNFDHFELLERNNFEDKNNDAQTAADEGEKVEEDKAEDKASKSVANAQVMLRIGGEDIHDCNRVILHRPSYSLDRHSLERHGLEHPLYSEPLPHYSNDIHYPCIHPHAAYPCLPSPFSFPGCYYGPFPSYATSYRDVNSHAVPDEIETSSAETHETLEKSDEEEIFLEPPKNEDVVCTKSAEPEEIVEEPCSNKIEEVEVVNVPEENDDVVEEQEVLVTEPESEQPEVVEISENTAKVSAPECFAVNTVQATTVEPSPTKVSYAEVNLADIGKPYLDTPKDDIVTLLDQALVPLSCQKHRRTHPFLVSYPVITKEGTVATISEEEASSECSTGSHDIFCRSCNRERNPRIPYGHRFSKDIDSLFEITTGSPDLSVPSCLYNEAPSESLIKVQSAHPPGKLKPISIVVPTEAECQPEQSLQQQSQEAKGVEFVSCEAVDSSCVKQEVVQECSPSSGAVTTVATPTPSTTLVTVEVPEVARRHESDHTDLASGKEHPCEKTEIIESPCATQEVVQVSNPTSHEPFRVQQSFREIYNAPPDVPNYQPIYTEYYPQNDIVQAINPYAQQIVGNSYHECPYSTQEIIQASKPPQEFQPGYQNNPFATAFTRPGSQTDVTFYKDGGSSPDSKYIPVENSYNEFSYAAPNTHHTVGIQPAYENFSTGASEVPTYQSLLSNLYSRREFVDTPNQYAESPCAQQLVQTGRSYDQAPYATQEIVQASNPGIYNEFPGVHVSDSSNHVSYSTQEVVQKTNPCSVSYNIQPAYSREPAAQGGESYNNVPWSGQQYSETVATEPVYNQAAYQTQEIVQKSHPCHNTVSIEPAYHQAAYHTQGIVQRSLPCHNTISREPVYNQAEYQTQEIVQRSHPSHNTISIEPVYNEAAYQTQEIVQRSRPCHNTISREPVYNQAEYQTQEIVQRSHPSHNTISIEPAYNEAAYQPQEIVQRSRPSHNTISIEPAYNEAAYQTQEIGEKSYPCHKAAYSGPLIDVRSSYEHADRDNRNAIRPRNGCSKAATAQSKREEIPTIGTRNLAPYATQRVYQATDSQPEPSTEPSEYNYYPSYGEASYEDQEVSQASYSGSQPTSVRSLFNKVPTVAQYQSGYSNPSSHISYSVSPYAAQHSVARPETSLATPSAKNHISSGQVGNSYSQASYETQQDSQTSYASSQPTSIQSYFTKVPSAAHYQTDHSKPASHNPYSASSYTAQHGVQDSTARPEASVTLLRGHNNVPTIQIGYSYSQALDGAQQGSQTNYPSSQPLNIQSLFNNLSTGAQYQTDHNTPAPHAASSYTSQYNVQVNSRPETSYTISGAQNNAPTVQAGNAYSQASYGTRQGRQTHYPSSQSILNKGPTVSQYHTEHSKPTHYASYSAPSYTTQDSVQASNAHPQLATATFAFTDLDQEKPQVFFIGNDGKVESELSIDCTGGGNQQSAQKAVSHHSGSVTSDLYKHPGAVDSSKPGNPSVPVSHYARYYEHRRPDQQTYQYSTSSGHQTESVHPFLSLWGDKASNAATSAYQHPAVARSGAPQPEVSQSHTYKVANRYYGAHQDDTRTHSVPDSVCADQYLQSDRPVYHSQQVSVDNAPQSHGYAQGWSYWKNLAGQSQVPLAHNYFTGYPACGASARYRGQLNQVSCDK